MAKKPFRFAKRLARWRWGIQTGFLLVWLGPLMVRMNTICGPVFHCHSCPLATFACPIGVMAQFTALHMIPFLAIGTLVVVGAMFGSLVCGWACPFGFLQDLIAKVPTPKFHLPAWMGFFRYAVLVGLVLVIPYFFGEEHPLFFCRLCPAGALEGAAPNMARLAIAGEPIAWPTVAKTTVLVVTLLAMFFTWRPWCTLFCPLGAVFGLLNRVSFFVVGSQPERCAGCNQCRNLCLDGGRATARIDGPQCVRCLNCTRCDSVSVGTVFSHPHKRPPRKENGDPPRNQPPE